MMQIFMIEKGLYSFLKRDPRLADVQCELDEDVQREASR
jgi:hypothetical protein